MQKNNTIYLGGLPLFGVDKKNNACYYQVEIPDITAMSVFESNAFCQYVLYFGHIETFVNGTSLNSLTCIQIKAIDKNSINMAVIWDSQLGKGGAIMVVSTGQVRKLDEIGRIVLPIEARKAIGAVGKQALEVLVDQSAGQIILQKGDSKD